MKYLIFRLYGPLAAWGDVAVGGTRPVFAHPSRSALLGLAGAALGIRRHEEDRLEELNRSFGIGLKVLSTGTALEDFHTIQGHSKMKPFATRYDELYYEPAKTGTQLSTRHYREDALVIAAFWQKEETSFSLDQTAEALRFPEFHLYLGRKSCPLSLPLEPQVKEAGSLKEALNCGEFGFTFPDSHIYKGRKVFEKESFAYFWEDHPAPGMQYARKTVRYDQPLNRQRWQFISREEFSAIEKKEIQ